MKLTRKRALRLTREWQARLGLKDWAIAVRVCRIKGCWGNADVLSEKRQAIVRIDPQTHANDPVRDWPWQQADHEKTIVHELLHCHLHQLRHKGKTRGHHEEQVIVALSDAFVKLKRRKR